MSPKRNGKIFSDCVHDLRDDEDDPRSEYVEARRDEEHQEYEGGRGEEYVVRADDGDDGDRSFRLTSHSKK